MEQKELLKKIADVVRECGTIILHADRSKSSIDEKAGHANFVTEYDKRIQQTLQKSLLGILPEAVFVGEEEEVHASIAKGYAFIVDPIDGTTNFVRDLRQSAISVALAKDGAVEYGVVYDPYRDEVFSARRGGGAFLNGRPIHVSGRPLAEGVFGMGTAIYRREYLEPTMRLTEQLFRRSCDFRRMGSAALDLCNVACGRTELFFEYSLCPWDYAAGSLLVTEAGGTACTLGGAPLPITERCSVWASNRVNHSILQELEV